MADPLAHRVLRGAYSDSLVLMQLHHALSGLPGVSAAAAVMATAANRELLAEQDLLPPDAGGAGPDDLLVVVRARDAGAGEAALARVEELLAARRGGGEAGAWRARSLATALAALPAARWVLVSVAGRWAAGVARDALDAGRHVFLFSDNVPLAEEVELKREAARRGLLVLGPDCGTAVVGGTGLGFANRLRRGGVGMVAASGTGLQAVACAIHARGGGISQALGTGSRDLSAEVGGTTALQALSLLARDPATRVITLVSKPPAPEVAGRVLRAAATCGKPVVVWFLAAPLSSRRLGMLHFATGSEEAAELAVYLAGEGAAGESTVAVGGRGRRFTPPPASPPGEEAGGRFLRGLFSGGTLAAESFLGLAPWLGPIASNLHLPGAAPLATAAGSHSLVDLGDDELTRGRPHPMLDPALVAEHLERAAADPGTGLLLLDVVLGDGAHPDPASVLAPVLGEALATARRQGRRLDAVALLVGTDADPQDRKAQAAALDAAGVKVVPGVAEAVRYALGALPSAQTEDAPPPVAVEDLAPPLVAVNVGLESFHAALVAQGAESVHVDWRPPAGGDERLARILERMKGRS
jgi:FdrA protein